MRLSLMLEAAAALWRVELFGSVVLTVAVFVVARAERRWHKQEEE